jgi:hypothetical protein
LEVISTSIMRVGILTAAQPPDTPYSQASRFVSKKAVKALLVSLCKRVAGRAEVIQERASVEIRVVRVIPTIVEKQYARKALSNRIVKKALPEPETNPNLDMAYPEAGRTSVRHKHEAMLRECQAAKRRNAANKGAQ